MTVYLRPGSPNYVIEFELRGHRIRQTSGTPKKREAEEEERQLRQQLKERQAGGHVEMTLAEAMRRYAETVVALGRSDGTRELSIFKRLGEAFGHDTTLDRITSPVVHKWRDGLLAGGHQGQPKKTKGASDPAEEQAKPRGLRPAAINRYLDVLKAVLRKAHFEWGALAKLPAIKSLKVNNAKLRFLGEPEEKALLEACPEHLRSFLVFLLGTGARRGEALDLTWSAVELGGNRRAAVTFQMTKNGKPRRVPLPEKVRDLLLAMRAAAPEGEERVFVWTVKKDGKETVVPFDSVKGSFETARTTAKLKDVSLHTLRHTYASRLVMRGVPIYNVSKLLGHSKIQMTMRYAHLAPEGLEESVAVLDS